MSVVEAERPAAPDPADEHRAGRGRRPVLIALAVLALPMVAALVVLSRHHWYPAGDMAQAELHLRGFWRHPPLVGAAGRIGTLEDQGSHPGPSMWFALYPVYRLFGASSFGLMVSVVTLHLASIAGILVVAWRRGGAALLWSVVPVLAVLVRASGPAFFTEPWNPWVAVLPFMLFVLLVWGAADDDLVLIPFAVAVGMHCVQSHIGYALLVGGLLGGLAVWLGVRAFRPHGPDRGRLLRMTIIAVAITVVMWVPPVVDQLVHSPGNLGILWHHFSSPDEPYVGARTAVKAFAGEFNLLGPWVVGRGHLPGTSPNMLGLVAMVVLWGAGIAAAVQLRARRQLLLHAVLGITCVLGLVAMTRIFGPFFDYVIRWMWPLAGLVVTASLWSMATFAVRAARRPAWLTMRHLGITSIVVTIALIAVATVQFADRAQLSGAPDSRVIGALIPQVAPKLDKHDRYLIRWIDPVALGAVGFGSVLELERRGYRPGVDHWARAGALPHRELAEADANGVVYIVLGPQIDRWRADPAATELGYVDPRTPAEAARSAELRARVETGLRDLGRDDLANRLDSQYGLGAALFAPGLPPALSNDIAELVGLRLPAAAFLVPPGTVPPP
jgi:hypothetical protein